MRRQTAVAVIAASARLATLALMALFDAIFADYDTSARLSAASAADQAGPAPFMVWDSMFFGRIASAGYEYEQFYAFFPLYPALVRLANLLGTSTAVGGVVVSNAAFVISAVFFDKLSLEVLQDQRTASMATLLYCFNAASVFCSAVYTESLFLALTFAGLCFLSRDKPWLATALLAFASSARSNGILSAWFLVHDGLGKFLRTWPRNKVGATVNLCTRAVQCITVVAPLAAFQLYGWLRFCRGPHAGISTPAWCSKPVPYIYGHVQSHYWGVGFLKYWQLSQVPNFVLGSPTLALAFCSCFTYMSADWARAWSLGLSTGRVDHEAQQQPFSSAHVRQQLRRSHGESRSTASGFYSDSVAVFIHHCGFMATFALCCMHVQVATRFLLAAPPLFWFASHLSQRGHAQHMWTWCLGFALLGCLLFTNFYPWT